MSGPPPAPAGPDPQPGAATRAGEQYFAPHPGSPSRRTQVRLSLPDLELALVSDRGVFSADRVDAGTRLLLQEAPSPAGVGHALDLGCGYGPLAVALARRAPDAQVWAVDVNERAVELTAENAAANGAAVHAVLVDPAGDPAPRADGTPPAEAVPPWPAFDLIWSNPPIRIGKAALHALLATWLDRLTPTGRAVLVVQRHLGADSLARWLAERGHPVERLVSRAGYRLLQVGARTPAPRDTSDHAHGPTGGGSGS